MKTGRVVQFKTTRDSGGACDRARRCNLCKVVFPTRTKFDRICHRCKQTDPLYRFSEWLPDKDQVMLDLESRLIA
jgi:hypothetical protein